MAALAATMLAFGLIAAGGGRASAATPPASQFNKDGWCHLNNGWGGSFFCQANTYDWWHQFPNGSWEVFVVGTNNQVWTRWNSSSGLSSWTSLSGQCLFNVLITGVDPNDGWHITIACTAVGSGVTYYNKRIGEASGHWIGWGTTP